MAKNNKKLLLLLPLLIFIDQISKYYFYDLKYMGWNYFFTTTLNKWISWWISIFHLNILLLITPVILAMIVYLYYKKDINFYTFLFIFAGWVWNYIDRIFYFGVRDFIDFHFFPIFNIADVFVSIWALLLLINIIRQHYQKH